MPLHLPHYNVLGIHVFLFDDFTIIVNLFLLFFLLNEHGLVVLLVGFLSTPHKLDESLFQSLGSGDDHFNVVCPYYQDFFGSHKGGILMLPGSGEMLDIVDDLDTSV